MSHATQVFWILAINTLLAVILLVVSFFLSERHRKSLELDAVLVLFCPVIAPLFLLCSIIVGYLTREQQVDTADISFDKTREKHHLPPNLQMERNFTSVEDAMSFSDIPELRHLMIDILKIDRRNNLSSVALALDSDDTEVSHYAASALQDALSEFRSTTQKMQSALLHTPEDVELNLQLLEYLFEGLSFQFMTDVEQRTYIYIADDVAQNLYDHNIWYMLAQHYLRMVCLLLSIRDYDRARQWCERAKVCRPEELDTYKAYFHFYYDTGQHEQFLQLLEKFMQAGVKADQETLNLIRLFRPLEFVAKE